MAALFLFVSVVTLCAQSYVPGDTYFGKDNYIEYHAGNLPLIISVPHGGRLEPTEIPDRDCEGCVYVQDSYTLELARQIKDAVVRQTGCYPHVVCNLLHRKKLDMNRDISEATDSNATLDVYWKDYQGFIDSAKANIRQRFGKGLFIDLHGHGHTKQRIEFGYLLYGSQLRESDSVMNTANRIRVSSIRNLVSNNVGGRSHAELIRGQHALGTLFADRGFPGVPSKQDPFPLTGDDYFNGGYNTLEHGSNPGGTIDAIQMELYSAIRFNTAQRKAFADSFATVVRSYLERHYFPDIAQNACQTSTVPERTIDDTEVYPNPATEHVIVTTHGEQSDYTTIQLIDMMGRGVVVNVVRTSPLTLDVSTLAQGTYILQLVSSPGIPTTPTMIVVAR
jgi:N-formylglutamate amidohydrolase